VDIAAIWAGIGEPSQVVYFKRMYISNVSKPYSVEPAQTTLKENLAPGDPEQRDPHELTQQQQIALQTGEKYPVPGTGPKRGFHFVTGELYLPSLTQRDQPTGQPGQPVSLRGIDSTYTPKFIRLFSGNWSAASWSTSRRLVGTRLQVELDANGNPRPKM
jgi:hypothetical protein